MDNPNAVLNHKICKLLSEKIRFFINIYRNVKLNRESWKNKRNRNA